MKRTDVLSDESKVVIVIYSFYIFSSIVAFIWAFVTNSYNGDYNDKSVFLSFTELLFILVLNVFPIIFTLMMYFHFKRKCIGRFVRVNNSKLVIFGILLQLLNLFLVIGFGFGKAGGAEYNAPGPIKLLIQILIRLFPSSWPMIYVYSAPKNKRKIKILIILISIITSLLCLSMGWVIGVGYVYFLLNYRKIVKFCKKHIVLTVSVLLFFPFIVGFAYNVRDIMRGQISSAISFTPGYLIFSKMFGRFSSYSATAVIYDYKDFFVNKAATFDKFFYLKSMLSFVSSHFAPTEVFEQVATMREAKNYSFMVGISGILLYSYYIDILVFLMNFILIFASIYLVFYLFSKLKFLYNMEYCALSMVMTVVAGTGYGIFSSLLCIVVLLIGTMVINNFFVPVNYIECGGYCV